MQIDVCCWQSEIRYQLHIHYYYLAVTILLLHMGCLCVHVQVLSLSIYLQMYIEIMRISFCIYLVKELKQYQTKKIISLISINDSCDLSYSHLDSQENSVLLQVVKVYVSVFGDERGKEVALTGLKSKAKYVRSELGRRMKLRLTPEIRFIEDESLERGSRVSNSNLMSNQRIDWVLVLVRGVQ